MVANHLYELSGNFREPKISSSNHPVPVRRNLAYRKIRRNKVLLHLHLLNFISTPTLIKQVEIINNHPCNPKYVENAVVEPATSCLTSAYQRHFHMNLDSNIVLHFIVTLDFP